MYHILTTFSIVTPLSSIMLYMFFYTSHSPHSHRAVGTHGTHSVQPSCKMHPSYTNGAESTHRAAIVQHAPIVHPSPHSHHIFHRCSTVFHHVVHVLLYTSFTTFFAIQDRHEQDVDFSRAVMFVPASEDTPASYVSHADTYHHRPEKLGPLSPVVFQMFFRKTRMTMNLTSNPDAEGTYTRLIRLIIIRIHHQCIHRVPIVLNAPIVHPSSTHRAAILHPSCMHRTPIVHPSCRMHPSCTHCEPIVQNAPIV